jgi:hypothetical protein
MAYARCGGRCEWYIFWDSAASASEGPGRESQSLAILHKNHRAKDPHFSYAQVRHMLQASDFSAIPGYASGDASLLTKCLSQFIGDVDEEFREAS